MKCKITKTMYFHNNFHNNVILEWSKYYVDYIYSVTQAAKALSEASLHSFSVEEGVGWHDRVSIDVTVCPISMLFDWAKG